MNNKQIIKDILIEELSKCNNFNYYVDIGNLNLVINTKKLYQSLIDNSYFFEGGIDSKVLFQNNFNKIFFLSYYNIWYKFEDKTQLKYLEIQSIVKDVLEESFKIKYIIPLFSILSGDNLTSFNFKGIILNANWKMISKLTRY